MNKSKRIKELENEVRKIRNELDENSDNQKIKEMSEKYKVKIQFSNFLDYWFIDSYELRLNNNIVKTDFITKKHKYIQSDEFERDIKVFLYDNSKKVKKEDK